MALTTLHLCTFNARSLCSRARLAEFQAEVDKIKYDVIGIAEVKRRGCGRLDLPNGAVLLYAGHDNKTADGVGFFVSPQLKSKIAGFTAVSPRVAELLLQIGRRGTMIRLIQVYAPTSTYNDATYDAFLDEISALLAKRLAGQRLVQTFVLGDFNAKIGTQQHNERAIGRFGFGSRNERGERLADFCNNHRLLVLNSFFRKSPQRKWTWRGPNGVTKNEIDYIISNDMRNISDVSVLNNFNTGSDHRLVRTTVNVKLRPRPRPTEQRRRLQMRFNRNVFKSACSLQLTTTTPPDDEITTTYDYIVTSVTTAMQAATSQELKPTPLSADTLRLLQRRRDIKRDAHVRNSIEYAELCKTIRKAVKHDLHQHHLRLIDEAIRSGSLRRARSELAEGRRQITALARNDGTSATTTTEILHIVQSFYETLYRSDRPSNAEDGEIMSDVNDDSNAPPFLEAEVRQALLKMKSGTCPGYDGITATALTAGAASLTPLLTRLFNNCLARSSIPTGFADAKTVLLFKKGDILNINNYRPISLLNTIYKAFTKVIGNRINTILDAAETAEQAGFRRSFSTIDHVFVINELIEKTTEYNLPLFMVFIDYEKAFDSVEIAAVWQALKRQNVPSNIITILKAIYQTAKSTIHVGADSVNVNIQKGVRQGDTISPRLFTACLSEVFNSVDWQHKGINVDGRYLSHLAFADDVVVLSHNYDQLRQMITELTAASLQVGLKINVKKTKLLANRSFDHAPLKIDGETIEEVTEFIYLGQLISYPRDHSREIRRRIQAGWSAFWKYRILFNARSIAMRQKRKLFNMCVAPSVLYGAETWALTKAAEKRLATAQRRMERRMIGARLLDKISNDRLRGITKVQDFVQAARQRKWRWAGKVANMSPERWARRISEWRPRTGKRDIGRPRRRWRDDIAKIAGKQWMRAARCDMEWGHLGEAYIRNDFE